MDIRVAQQRAAARTRQHHWVYQLVAVCLLLLAASPVTAPFSTCDLSPEANHACTSDLTKATFDSDQAPLVGVGLVSVPLAPRMLVVRASALPLHRVETARTPLRI